MKVLFIGGTGNISSAVSREAVAQGIDLFRLNPFNDDQPIKGAKHIQADINKPEEVREAIKGHQWDAVVNWIGFTVADMERDIQLFTGKTKQYMFISSSSVYQKPLSHPIITESTPLKNPHWDYSRNKIACELRLNEEYRERDFPITIVRPSLTYDTVIPVAVGSWNDYTIVDRMLKGKKVIVHGDGTSLWTVTHAEDFARGFVPLIGHQQVIGHSFHITSDEVLTWDQIYDAVASAVGAEAKKVYIPSTYIMQMVDWHEGNLLGDKAVSAIFDNSKLKMFVPTFKAIIPFKAGIKRTIQWFQADPKRMVISDYNNQYLDKIIESYEKNFPPKA